MILDVLVNTFITDFKKDKRMDDAFRFLPRRRCKCLYTNASTETREYVCKSFDDSEDLPVRYVCPISTFTNHS